MKLNKLIFFKPSKENSFCKIDKNITTSSGIYFLFDKDLELIYIGKAKNIRSRIQQHTSHGNNGRLSLGDVGTYFERRYNTCIPYGIIKYYSFILEVDEEKRNLAELILLSLIKTRFNGGDKIRAIQNYFKDKQEQNINKGE